jgi:nitrogen regulatory protein PII
MLSKEQTADIGYSLITITVNRGKGSKILQFAQEIGIKDASCLFGKGTIKDDFSQLMEVNEVNKEVLMMVIPSDREDEIMDKLNQKFQLYKENHGIAFSTPLTRLLNPSKEPAVHWKDHTASPDKRGNYSVVYVIVDRGKGKTVIEVSQDAGYYGGTILRAHGSASKLNLVLDMQVEPEKEIVLIVVGRKRVNQLTSLLYEYFNLSEANTGILYVADINKMAGIFREEETHPPISSKDYDRAYMIMARVMYGFSGRIIKAANTAGATGATILKARGEKIHGKGGIFDFKIEPEEELVLIIAAEEIAEVIGRSIYHELKIIDHGGMLCAMPIFCMNPNVISSAKH